MLVVVTMAANLQAKETLASIMKGVIVHLRYRGHRAVYIASENRNLLGPAVAERFFKEHFPGKGDDGTPL